MDETFFNNADEAIEDEAPTKRAVRYGPLMVSSGVTNQMKGGMRLPIEFKPPGNDPFARPDITRRDHRSHGLHVEGKLRQDRSQRKARVDDGTELGEGISSNDEDSEGSPQVKNTKRRKTGSSEVDERDGGFGKAIPIDDIIDETDTTKYDECPLCAILIHCKSLNGEKRPEWFEKFAAFSQDATFKIHPQQKYRTIKAFYDKEVKNTRPEFGNLSIEMAENHYTTHMKEPSCMLRKQLDNLDAIISKLSNNIVYDDLETGRIAIDKDNMRAYSSLIDLRFKISRIDPTRMIGSIENMTSVTVDAANKSAGQDSGAFGAKKDLKQNVKM